MSSNNIYEIGNVEGSSKYKPQNARYNDSWIEFWQDKASTNKPQFCCVVDCKHNDEIVGGHIYVSLELSKTIEADLNSFCTRTLMRAQNGLLNDNGVCYKAYGNLFVIMRCGENLVKTETGNLVFIAPICNSCNQRNGKFFLRAGTVLVPLYWSDQKEIS